LIIIQSVKFASLLHHQSTKHQNLTLNLLLFVPPQKIPYCSSRTYLIPPQTFPNSNSKLPSFLTYLIKRWQAVVNPGKWITTDESRVAGWYHSVMTIGPDPKPIRTGATLHTACITKGPLATYKIFARVYGGEGDQDNINKRNPHTATRLKMVSLFDFMLDSFKGKGPDTVLSWILLT
jgi:hypothetical protein